MIANTPKEIKSRLIEIYNEELLNLNIFIKNRDELEGNRDLRYLLLERIRKEFDYLDDEELFTILSFYQTFPSFYRRTFNKILNASLDKKYIEIQDDSLKLAEIIKEEVSNIDEAIEEQNLKIEEKLLERLYNQKGEDSDVNNLNQEKSLDINNLTDEEILELYNISDEEFSQLQDCYEWEIFESDFLNEEILKDFDESAFLDIAYNHKDAELRGFALGMVLKPHIWLDFLFNDSDLFIRKSALFYLFKERYLKDIEDIDYLGKIPMEIDFELDYEDPIDDFGIYDPLFKRHDKLTISEISFKDDELIVKTDPKNSYEHAVSKITNPDALKAIANYHNRWSVRYIAVNKITDIDYLYDIALNGFNKDAKPRHGILYYHGEISEGDVLESLLNRLLKLKNLSDVDSQSFLKELFYKSKDSIIRRYCLSKIKDDIFLVNIANTEANPSFARVCLDTITDEDYLILLSIAIITSPIFNGKYLDLNDGLFKGDIADEDSFISELSQFDEIDYRNIRAYASKILIALPRETLNKTIKSFCLKSDFDSLKGQSFFKPLFDKRIIDILGVLAKTDESPLVRSIAVLAIEDADDLKSIALGDNDDKVSFNAIKKLNDDDFIEYYLKESNRKAYYLVEGDLVKDQSLLKKIALNDSWGPTRSEAVRNIKDEDLLITIAKNDPEAIVRREAVLKIKNQSALIDIAYEDEDNLVRDFAISNIDDGDVLEDLIYRNEDSNILRTILSKLNNGELIKDFAYNHPRGIVRNAAISNIDDIRVLVDIAKTDEDWTVRRNIIARLVGKFIKISVDVYEDKYLNHLKRREYYDSLINEGNGGFESVDNTKSSEKYAKSVDNDEYVDASSIVLYEDEESYTLQDLLVDRALNDESERVRAFVVSYISDEYLLFDIVNNDKSIKVQLSAIDGIERNELLAKIFVKSKNHHVYRKAISKIKYEYILLKLVCLKNYYGELWPKRQMAEARMEELGFKSPLIKKEDNRNKKFFRPLYDIRDYQRDLELLDRLDKEYGDRKNDSDDSDSSSDSLNDSSVDFPFKRIVF